MHDNGRCITHAPRGTPIGMMLHSLGASGKRRAGGCTAASQLPGCCAARAPTSHNRPTCHQ